jgi:tripartite-type tricarboxylate transporter receptor subunit TctC
MKRWCILAAAIALVITVAPLQAQPYPNRPIRLIVPFPAGGAADVAARAVAQALGQSLGQTLVIDNRAGADGAIAGEAVKNAEPDGYTLLFATTTGLNAVPTLRKQPPYNAITDFTPISLVGKFGFFLFVHERLPVKSVAEFLAYVRANPGKVNYATGNGTSILATAQLALVEKLDMQHIPYRGDAPATTDLIGGRVQVMIGTPGSAMSRRSPLAPDAPTVTEVGLSKLTITPWAGLFGPAKLPKDVVDRLAAAMKTVAGLSDVREQLDRIAFELQASTPEEMAAILKDQLDVWQRTVQEVGMERN